MAFTPEDVADYDVPGNPYFTVSEYVKRLRALALALLLVGSALTFADPQFGTFVLTKAQAASASVTGIFDGVTSWYLTGLASLAL
jgi:hypothetical protein